MSDEPDSNAWMVTFSDLLTLLLTFFVLILSMSSLDSQKVKDVFGLFPGAPGVLFEGPSNQKEHWKSDPSRPGTPTLPSIPAKEARDAQREWLDAQLEDIDEAAVAGSARQAQVVTTQVTFAAGSSRLDEPALETLAGLAESIPAGTVVRVDGHADAREEDGREPWALSLERAVRVAERLVASGLVAETQVQSHAFGAERPRVSGAVAELSARNRRVEIHHANPDPPETTIEADETVLERLRDALVGRVGDLAR